MSTAKDTIARARAFADGLGLRVPVLLAPMAGACPPALSIAVANAGGMGACGALVMTPDQIRGWAGEVRAGTDRPFQLNTWIPDPPPARDAHHEAEVRAFLARWAPEVPAEAADAPLADFAAQCDAMIEARPAAMSSIMGLYPPEVVARIKAAGIRWFATVTTVAEAVAAERAGADVIVAQGMEAGGHRGAFDAGAAERNLVGLFALLPAVCDAVRLPVVATGGIADARGVAAALLLGASAVQVGTGLLRSTEAGLPAAWADGIGAAGPEDTVATRAFSGRLGRALATTYAAAAAAPGAPAPAPYPIQRHLTRSLRDEAARTGSLDLMQAWAGQSARLARTGSAGEIVAALWEGAEEALG